MGKAKGFLTTDEVHEHLPEAECRPLRWTTGCRRSRTRGSRSSTRRRARRPKVSRFGIRTRPPTPRRGQRRVEIVDAVEAKKDEDEPEEDADDSAAPVDPVRMYLRKMGLVALLTREGEVEISKRMEEGAAPRPAGGAELFDRDRGDPQPGRRAPQGEDPRQGGRQGHRRGGCRVRRAVARRAGLQGDRQGPPALEGAGEGRREAGDQALGPHQEEVPKLRSTSSSRRW